MTQPHDTPSSAPAAPIGGHHYAYVTHDVQETTYFYSGVMGLRLVAAVFDDKVPSTDDPYPYAHIFFELGDGSMLAFFESPGLPPPAEPSHPAYGVFEHLALNVGSKEEVDRWAAHLKRHGVDVVGPVEHVLIYSIYFHDPNGVRLELTATTEHSWITAGGEQAKADLAEWSAIKQSSGGDPKPLRAWIHERARKHREIYGD